MHISRVSGPVKYVQSRFIAFCQCSDSVLSVFYRVCFVRDSGYVTDRCIRKHNNNFLKLISASKEIGLRLLGEVIQKETTKISAKCCYERF